MAAAGAGRVIPASGTVVATAFAGIGSPAAGMGVTSSAVALNGFSALKCLGRWLLRRRYAAFMAALAFFHFIFAPVPMLQGSGMPVLRCR